MMKNKPKPKPEPGVYLYGRDSTRKQLSEPYYGSPYT